MQFSSKEDIEVPIERVFDMLSEFESYERSAIRRGIDVRRVDDGAPIGAGLVWEVSFKMRGKPRDMTLEVVEYVQPTIIRIESESQGIHGAMLIELMALSPRRTRMSVLLEMDAKTLSARLLMQSLKLAKSNLSKRFNLKVADYAKDMENRASRLA